MSPALGLAGAIIGAVALVVVALLRLNRASPDQRLADAAVWTSLRGGYDAQVADLRSDVAGLRTQVEQMRPQVEAGQRAEREVAWLRGVIVAGIRPIVDWLDSGARGQVPPVTPELRSLLAEAEQHERDPNTL